MKNIIWGNGPTPESFRFDIYELVNLSEGITEIREYKPSGAYQILDYTYATETESALQQAKNHVETIVNEQDAKKAALQETAPELLAACKNLLRIAQNSGNIHQVHLLAPLVAKAEGHLQPATQTVEVPLSSLNIGERFINPLNGDLVEYSGKQTSLSGEVQHTFRLIFPNGKTNYTATLRSIPAKTRAVSVLIGKEGSAAR